MARTNGTLPAPLAMAARRFEKWRRRGRPRLPAGRFGSSPRMERGPLSRVYSASSAQIPARTRRRRGWPLAFGREAMMCWWPARRPFPRSVVAPDGHIVGRTSGRDQEAFERINCETGVAVESGGKHAATPATSLQPLRIIRG